MGKRGLGRGLESLIAGALSDDDASSVRFVPVERIRQNAFQPRRAIDDQKLAELAQSIREHGVLQPVLVRRVAVDEYELVAGERRLLAARAAGLPTVPVIVKQYGNEQMLEVALIENLQREDISPVDAALAYRRLQAEFGLTQQEIASRVGKSQSAIANTMRLLGLPAEILESIGRGETTEGHARAILQAHPAYRVDVWNRIQRQGLNVRDAERLARERQAGSTPPPSISAGRREAEEIDPHRLAMEEALRQALGTKVHVRYSDGRGRIEIDFYTDDQLEGILRRIVGEGDSP